MTSSSGDWVAVPVPGEPDRWDFVPTEQPPSPDGTPGEWHVVGGSGAEVGQWEWFPAADAAPAATPATPAPSLFPPPPPPVWEQAAPEPIAPEPVAWPSMPEPAEWPSMPEPATWEPGAYEPAAYEPAAYEPAAYEPPAPVVPQPVAAPSSSWLTAAQEPAHAGFPVPPPPDWGSDQPFLATPAPRRSRKLPLAIVGGILSIALIAVVAVVALSGGDDGKKKDEITALVTFVTTADDGAQVCSSHLTENFVRTVFGDLATCERDDDTDGDEGDATGATVTDFAFDDDTATARVTVTGGDTDGATGTWAFQQGTDKMWRVSEWRADYLRSTFERTFGENYAIDGTNDPFSDVELRACVKDRLLAQDDAAFLDTAYALFRDSDQSTQKLLGLMSQCPSDTEGVSALRALFEEGLRARISTQLAPPLTDCAITEWRVVIPEPEVLKMMERPGAPLPSDIQARMQEVLLECAGRSS